LPAGSLIARLCAPARNVMQCTDTVARASRTCGTLMTSDRRVRAFLPQRCGDKEKK